MFVRTDSFAGTLSYNRPHGCLLGAYYGEEERQSGQKTPGISQ